MMTINKEYILYRLSAGLSVFAAFMAISIYVTKQDTKSIVQKINHITHSIDQKKRMLHTLTSEWSHLNNPQNLRKINKKVLKLKSLHPRQTSSLAL